MFGQTMASRKQKLSTLTDKIRMWDIHILRREGAGLSYSEEEVTGFIFSANQGLLVQKTLQLDFVLLCETQMEGI